MEKFPLDFGENFDCENFNPHFNQALYQNTDQFSTVLDFDDFDCSESRMLSSAFNGSGCDSPFPSYPNLAHTEEPLQYEPLTENCLRPELLADDFRMNEVYSCSEFDHIGSQVEVPHEATPINHPYPSVTAGTSDEVFHNQMNQTSPSRDSYSPGSSEQLFEIASSIELTELPKNGGIGILLNNRLGAEVDFIAICQNTPFPQRGPVPNYDDFTSHQEFIDQNIDLDKAAHEKFKRQRITLQSQMALILKEGSRKIFQTEQHDPGKAEVMALSLLHNVVQKYQSYQCGEDISENPVIIPKPSKSKEPKRLQKAKSPRQPKKGRKTYRYSN